jgi:hypothetical protein
VRTTVTLDADTEALLRRRMEERKVSFKRALNDAIRDGLGATTRTERFETPVASLGAPRTTLDQALQLVAELEDEELVARMRAQS